MLGDDAPCCATCCRPVQMNSVFLRSTSSELANGEVATSLIKVGLLGHSGLDLLALSSSRFDPKLTLCSIVVMSASW